MSWTEFLNPQYKMCGLCGNTGIIDTRDSATSPVGIKTGGLHYCVCPNGRALRKLKVKLEEHLALLTVRQERVSFFIVCNELQRLIATNVNQAKLQKEDFVKVVKSLGWYWDEFEERLREYQSLANKIIDTIYNRGI